mmetsp:Transcript_9302/g.21480  ORF Transcript_9302/g.21480 Transcript_9302/m.21480 type:complete len:453 (+) Transcript_9302:640-1998(+)
MLQVVDLATQVVDLSNQSDILLQDSHVVLPMNLRILEELLLETLHRLLQVVSLSVVLTLDVAVELLVFDTIRNVFLVQTLSGVSQSGWFLDELHGLVQVILEPLDDRLAVTHLLALANDFFLKALLFVAELLDVDLELFVFSVVVLKVRIHGLDSQLHDVNVVILWINLCFQFTDLVVENELELLQLLVLLLEVIDSALFVANCPIAVFDFLKVVISVLDQLVYLLLLLSRLFLVVTKLLFLFRHLAFQVLVIPLVNTRLSTQPHLVILLQLEPLLFFILELLYLSIGVLLQLPHCLLVHTLGQTLLLHNEADLVLVARLLLCKLAMHVIDGAVVSIDHVVMLLFPLLVHAIPLSCHLLVSTHLDHHLVLKRCLKILGLLSMQLLQAFCVLLVLHLQVILLLAQDLILGTFLLNLLAILLFQLNHLFLVVALSMPQLELNLVGELFNLSFQL